MDWKQVKQISAEGKKNVECKREYREKPEIIDQILNKKLITSGMVGGTVREEGRVGWGWNGSLKQQNQNFLGKGAWILMRSLQKHAHATVR